jgi:hypothetical protein
LNTVERRKIRSGSSAADAGAACQSTNANTPKARLLNFLLHLMMALDVIDISAEGLVAYVVAESRTGRPPSGDGRDAQLTAL